MKNKIKHWDTMYELPLEKVPWEIQDPPKELVEVIEHKTVMPGNVLDMGCGSGNYAIYLAP